MKNLFLVKFEIRHGDNEYSLYDICSSESDTLDDREAFEQYWEYPLPPRDSLLGFHWLQCDKALLGMSVTPITIPQASTLKALGVCH